MRGQGVKSLKDVKLLIWQEKVLCSPTASGGFQKQVNLPEILQPWNCTQVDSSSCRFSGSCTSTFAWVEGNCMKPEVKLFSGSYLGQNLLRKGAHQTHSTEGGVMQTGCSTRLWKMLSLSFSPNWKWKHNSELLLFGFVLLQTELLSVCFLCFATVRALWEEVCPSEIKTTVTSQQWTVILFNQTKLLPVPCSASAAVDEVLTDCIVRSGLTLSASFEPALFTVANKPAPVDHAFPAAVPHLPGVEAGAGAGGKRATRPRPPAPRVSRCSLPDGARPRRREAAAPTPVGQRRVLLAEDGTAASAASSPSRRAGPPLPPSRRVRSASRRSLRGARGGVFRLSPAALSRGGRRSSRLPAGRRRVPCYKL
ncbi:hypothetical protein EYD10_12917 [Varanus komodoensis]|nr:hypothetical protein EYD10_12917 [Varanus komodoensis]